MSPSSASATTDRGLLRHRVRLLLGLVAAAIVAVLGSSAAARADLQVSHVSYTATEVAGSSDGDGIVGPGDAFKLNETVQSSNTSGTLTNVTGALQTAASGVSVTQGSSPYPNLTFGVPATNTTPFQATIAAGLDCGVNVPFTLQLSANQGGTPGTQPVQFTMQTGAQGAFNGYTSTQVPLSIPDVGQAISSFNVPTSGRVKRVRVQIGSLTHTYDGDLRLELIAPDGTDVHLIEPNSANNGKNFVNTVFDDSAATSITSASAPYTGSFKPVQPLSALTGVQQQGTWQLKVTDVSPGDTGTLNAWGESVAPAVCTTAPIGSFTATPNPATPASPVSFDGSASVSPSPGATITDYKWNFGDGSAVLDTGSTPTTSHVYGVRGKYTVALTVTDSLGKSSQATLTESVTQAPVAAIVPTPPNPISGQTVMFDASSSTHDPGGSIVDYKWDLDGSGNYATDTGNAATVTTAYPTQRTVAVSVRVTDDTGASSVATTSVTVGNAPPVASFTAPSLILVGAAVTFDGTSSHDIDGSVTDYKWDLNGSGGYSTDTGSTPSAATTFNAPGFVTVGLRVTDNDGAVTQTTRTIHVTRPPLAQLKATPASPTSGQVVTLDASGSTDPDGTLTAFQWDLDGSGQFATSSGTTPSIQHTFATGTYPIRVRVTDSYGATATALLNLTVAPAAGSGGGGGTGGGGLLAQIGATVGGSPTAGIAALTGGDLKAIAAGSDNHFATVTGAPVRTAAAVAKKGLWVNLLSDRPATFSLTVSVPASDARRLHIARVRKGKSKGLGPPRRVASLAASLSVAGQRPLDIVLPASVKSKLAKLRGQLQLVVSGAATDAQGHRAAVSRAFLVRR